MHAKVTPCKDVPVQKYNFAKVTPRLKKTFLAKKMLCKNVAVIM